MPFWDRFSGKNRNDDEPRLPQIGDFVRERRESGEDLFLASRPNGKQVALALAPLTAHKNKYGDEVEDGQATILVEGQKSLSTAVWYQGRASELSWDQGKPVGGDPFAPGQKVSGTLNFSSVEKGAPFHDAFGLDWWSEGDGSTLRTLLNYYTLPEARLIWRRSDPASEPPLPVTPAGEIRDLVGAWARSHQVEGKVVVDPTEGSGFSTEGEECWSERVVVWEDGAVTALDDWSWRGQFHGAILRWDSPAEGRAPAGPRPSSEHFRPYDGPVEASGEALVIGGYTFMRVADTEPA